VRALQQRRRRRRNDAPKKPIPVLAEDAAEMPAEFVGEPRLVRLNKYLADHGVASRRKCDELIMTGQVTVDGQSVTELGTKIDPEKHKVEIDGVYLKQKDARRRYYLLNKPSGVVCTNEPRETRPRAVDLVTDPAKGRIYTVGRLDEESKGLIILTNDGDFANKIMHPRYGIDKTYVVRVAGRIDDDTVQKIREGVHLSEGRTSGARILVDRRTADASQLTLTIHEGMNREIRRVFARFGYKVTDLRRVRIGPLDDRGLKPGRWRELLNREVEALIKGQTSMGLDAAPRANKRFPKKRGYARELVRGGRLVPGAAREREPRVRFGPKPPKKEKGGPRSPVGRVQRKTR
jgi:23S rRNA pseudouridine2605 synthase